MAGTFRNKKCCAIERMRFSIANFDMKLLFFDIKTTVEMKDLRSERITVLGKSLYLNRSPSYSSLKSRKRVAIERTRFSIAIFDMKL